jgi:hypothetical protein
MVHPTHGFGSQRDLARIGIDRIAAVTPWPPGPGLAGLPVAPARLAS